MLHLHETLLIALFSRRDRRAHFSFPDLYLPLVSSLVSFLSFSSSHSSFLLSTMSDSSSPRAEPATLETLEQRVAQLERRDKSRELYVLMKEKKDLLTAEMKSYSDNIIIKGMKFSIKDVQKDAAAEEKFCENALQVFVDQGLIAAVKIFVLKGDQKGRILRGVICHAHPLGAKDNCSVVVAFLESWFVATILGKIANGKKLTNGIRICQHMPPILDACNKIANKISRNTGVLHRVKKLLPPTSLLTIYYSLIFSHFSYALEIWGASPAKSFKRIEGIQKKAVHAITKSHFLAHTEPRMKMLSLLNVADQHKLQCLSLTFNMIKGFCPDVLDFRQSMNETRIRYRLRSVSTQPENLRPVNHLSRSFPSLATQYWNELDPDLKNSSTKREFKGRVKRTFIQSYVSICDCSNPLCVDRQYHSQ